MAFEAPPRKYTVSPNLSPLPSSLSALRSAYPHITQFMASAVAILPHRPYLSHSSHLTLPSFLTSSPADVPHALILQRTHTDSFPGLYEYPGGSSSEGDENIYDTITREAHEETGLTVTAVRGFLGLEDWPEGKGRWGKFSYLVEVEDQGDVEVKIAEEEHDAFIWVSEEGVRAMIEGMGGLDERANVDWKVNGPRREWDFVVKEVGEKVLEGFAMWKTLREDRVRDSG